MARSVYSRLESRISHDERGGIVTRWEYGRAILADRKKMTASGNQLRVGATEALIADAKAVGSKLSEREIRYRLECARAYKSVDEIRHACAEFGDWSSLREAGFPSVDIDETDELIEDLEAAGADAQTEDDLHQDPLFDIPGFKAVLKIRGRKVDLADVTVREAIDYRDMCHEMHDNFGRTIAEIDASVQAMIDGSGGDLDANALEAWRRATGDGD